MSLPEFLLAVAASIFAMVLWALWQRKTTSAHIEDRTANILFLAIGLLPEHERERYEEEWLGHISLEEQPIRRFLIALDFLRAATTISGQVRLLYPVARAFSSMKTGFGLNLTSEWKVKNTATLIIENKTFLLS